MCRETQPTNQQPVLCPLLRTGETTKRFMQCSHYHSAQEQATNWIVPITGRLLYSLLQEKSLQGFC